FAVATYVVRCFAVSAGYHRYFSHRSFETSRPVQFLLAFVGGMAVMRSALWWASIHRRHHRYADGPGDPHSPREGFWWAHLLWFMGRDNQSLDPESIRDFWRYPELRFLHRHEWVPIAVFVAGTVAVGGFAGWVWAANVSTVLLCHATFALNSITHLWGRVDHEVKDDSRNLLMVALPTFGEGWHNNHHRSPSRARLGEGWAQIDISWIGIRVLEKLGLVWNVRR
ncbi:MAG: acyl-CoA desaturase, partial [Planctomycetes bacterium]|nr:acyl-CoA desaturase [Planctomycetota bacterium]